MSSASVIPRVWASVDVRDSPEPNEGGIGRISTGYSGVVGTGELSGANGNGEAYRTIGPEDRHLLPAVPLLQSGLAHELQEDVDGDARLEAGERCAWTEVLPPAEGVVRRRIRSVDIEAVGLREHLRIPVGSGHAEH